VIFDLLMMMYVVGSVCGKSRRGRRGRRGWRAGGPGCGYTSLPNTVILMEMRKTDISGKIYEGGD